MLNAKRGEDRAFGTTYLVHSAGCFLLFLLLLYKRKPKSGVTNTMTPMTPAIVPPITAPMSMEEVASEGDVCNDHNSEYWHTTSLGFAVA